MRKKRELRDVARYHVTARVNAQEMLLGPSAIKELFLATVARAKRKYVFQIENFCIMDNHVHLIISPLDGRDLPAIMRWILSVFAMAYNRRQGRTGHVWGERYFSKILGTLREFETTFRYIDENPVAAGAVPLPWQWRCGGLGHARLGRRDIIGEVADWILLLFPNHAIGLRDG